MRQPTKAHTQQQPRQEFPAQPNIHHASDVIFGLVGGLIFVPIAWALWRFVGMRLGYRTVTVVRKGRRI